MRQKDAKGKIKVVIIAIVAVVLILSVFGFAMSSRVGVNYSTKSIGHSTISYNENSILNKLTPKWFHPTLAVANHYLAQGYYGLEMGISESWHPTFLVGSSRFIMDNFSELTGLDVFSETYQVRLYQHTGWHYDIYWHTAYLWIANDFSLIGVAVFLFMLFAYWGQSWKKFIDEGNPFGYLSIVLFAQFMFYISANNNLFSYSETLIAFIIVSVYMMKTHYYTWESME